MAAASGYRWRALLGISALTVALVAGGTPATSGAAAAPSGVAAAPAGAVAADVIPAAAAPQVERIHYGSPGPVSDAGIFLARARGFFQEQGFEVELVPIQSGPDLIAPMGAGQIEVGGGTFNIGLLNAIDRGVAIKIVADKGQSRPGFEFSQLPVRRELMESGAVRTPADLRGRKLAVASTRAGAEAIAAQVLKQGGLTVDDVDLTVLGYPDMLPALSNAAIDGGVIIEPTLSAALTRGLAVGWEPGYSSVAYGGPYQAGVLYYSPRFTQQPELGRRFMTAYLKGVRVYNDAFVKGIGRADVIRLLTEETAIKDPAVYEVMQMAGLDPEGRLARQPLQIELDYFRQRGYYSGNATLESAIDSSFADYASAQLGPYQ